MTSVDAFEREMPIALARLAQDEWALTALRERVVAEADAAAAFEGVVPALRLAPAQMDPYAFVSCCWLAIGFAQRSGTTQEPEGLRQALDAVAVAAQKFGATAELLPLRAWYRLPRSPSLEPNAGGTVPSETHLQR